MLGFREIVVADFEFSAPAGEQPRPVCGVFYELVSGRRGRMSEDQLHSLASPPYPIGRDTLFVAYYASAELGCHLALDWALPIYVLDLFAEFRNKTNGLPPPCGNGLLGAMIYHGLTGVDVAEKDSMRKLALRGGPWTAEETQQLLDYCESDVSALAQLFSRMMPELDLPRALLRGRYMAAAARMEACGVPIDTKTLVALRENWPAMKLELIRRIDVYQIYEGTTFKADRWAKRVAAERIPWPQLASGRLDLSDDAFHLMADRFPAIEPYRQLRFLLAQMRLEDLAVGSDDRNRCLLSAFSARTSRNQPSNTKFIFGLAVWRRGLIRPSPGYGLAYIDYSQQEFGIAAYLSGDQNMIAAYESGDPYLAFAKQSGAVPADATRETHSAERELFKACALAVLYGMGEESLAQRTGQSPAHTRELLQIHRETFPKFWRFSDAALEHAMLLGFLHTTFGWKVQVGPGTNPRMLQNFPMQANGAEMLRLACCIATEAGVRVCAPIHDAILVEAPLDELDETVRIAREAMGKASEIVLGGFRIRTDVKVFQYPNRFEDARGREMWNAVSSILAQLQTASNNSFCINNVPPHTPDTPHTPHTPDTVDASDCPGDFVARGREAV